MEALVGGVVDRDEEGGGEAGYLSGVGVEVVG